MEKIVAAAIRYQGLVCVVERPGRHHDVFHQLRDLGWHQGIHVHQQGFITSTGRFVDREAARQIAEKADQIIKSDKDDAGIPIKREHSQLFSEDVW